MHICSRKLVTHRFCQGREQYMVKVHGKHAKEPIAASSGERVC